MNNFKSISRAVNRGHLMLTADKDNVYVVTNTKVKTKRRVHMVIPKIAFDNMPNNNVTPRGEIKTRRNRTVKHFN